MLDDLQAMYDAQRVDQIDRYGVDPAELDLQQWADYVRTMVVALDDELHEALREVPWKPWSNRTDKEFDSGAVKAEFADAWHFFMNLMIAMRVRPEDLVSSYFRKLAINQERKSNHYISATG
jgi:dimeric dUTPase (all-alpha-NTP-PPase superfamily)